MEKRTTKLSEVTLRITKGTTPTTEGAKFTSSGINYIKSECISYDGRINKEAFTFISEQTHEKLKRSQLQEGDILFSMAGVFLGKNAIVTSDILPANTNQALAIIRVDSNKIFVKYLHYYLRMNSVIEHVNNISGQSAQPNINMEEIGSIEIPLPPLPEQEAIAEVLSSLDDKIDLLHRNNKTLEQLAETLFRQWFIEEADDSWEEVTIESLCERITKGTTPTTLGRQFKDAGINFIKAESLSENGGFINAKFSYIDEGTNEVLSRSKLKEGDILFTIAGTIGRTSMVTKDILPANTNQAVAIIRVNRISPYYMKYVMRTNVIKDIMNSKIVHAVQPNLSLGEISNTIVSLPPHSKLKIFDDYVIDINKKINYNIDQIKQLEQLRDTLLPKLMNGEVRVQDVKTTIPA